MSDEAVREAAWAFNHLKLALAELKGFRSPNDPLPLDELPLVYIGHRLARMLEPERVLTDLAVVDEILMMGVPPEQLVGHPAVDDAHPGYMPEEQPPGYPPGMNTFGAAEVMAQFQASQKEQVCPGCVHALTYPIDAPDHTCGSEPGYMTINEGYSAAQRAQIRERDAVLKNAGGAPPTDSPMNPEYLLKMQRESDSRNSEKSEGVQHLCNNGNVLRKGRITSCSLCYDDITATAVKVLRENAPHDPFLEGIMEGFEPSGECLACDQSNRDLGGPKLEHTCETVEVTPARDRKCYACSFVKTMDREPNPELEEHYAHTCDKATT